MEVDTLTVIERDEPDDEQAKRGMVEFVKRDPDAAADQLLRQESELFSLRVQHRGAVDVERIARALAECFVGVQVRGEDEPVDVGRIHRDIANYIVRGQ